MENYLWQLPFLFIAGIGAGIINIVAGGGSLMTMPLLIFMGLPSTMANGTNRIAIVGQSISAIYNFRKSAVLPFKIALICTPPALLGSWFGASLALNIDDALFNRLLALIMIGVLIFTAIDPLKRMRQKTPELRIRGKIILVIAFFGIGIYGGFIQAGVGFIIIPFLLAFGFDLVHINVIKVFVIFVYTLLALGIFIYHGQIDYSLGLALAAGNTIGGALGAKLTISKGHDWIKKIVVIMILIFAIKLLFWP
jgi:uncharacterized membrane protein YfcA